MTTAEQYSVKDFNVLLVTSCDMHGVARGRYVFQNSIQGVLDKGLGMTQASLFSGIKCDIPLNLTDYKTQGWTNGTLVPDVTTLKPVSWISYGGQKVGHVLCDLYDPRENIEESSPRALARQQLTVLRNLGYEIVTSQDLHITIFYKETTTLVDIQDITCQFLTSLQTSLQSTGLPVTSVRPGLAAGQLHISLADQPGIEAADNLHRLRNALRSLCVLGGFDVTFMTCPLSDVRGNDVGYKVTLRGQGDRNAFSQEGQEKSLSSLGRHWLAGCLGHQAALSALVRPTLNCYSVVQDQEASWTFADGSDRTHRLQVRVDHNGVSIVDTLPSLASNPYIVLAALIAAGIDGILNKTELSSQDARCGQVKTLDQALRALEADEGIRNSLGSRFLHRFLILKRDFEVKRAENRQDSTDKFQFERSLYLKTL